MHGFLVPSSGGRTIALKRTRLFLGRVKGDDAPLSRENAFCQLELIEGFWHIEDLNTPNGVKVNGRTCKRERLMPDDELTIGKHRYRINFDAPQYSGVGKLAKSPRRQTKQAEEKTPAADPSRYAATREYPTSGVVGRLVPLGGGEEIVINKPKVTIGRRSPCDIVIEYRSISGQHCELDLLNGYWQVTDLGSRNGIRVNNVKVDKAWILPNGRLSLAEHRYQLDYVGVGDPPVDAMEQQASGDQRSFMDKLGLTERDLERAAFDPDEGSTVSRKYNLMDND